MAITAALRRRRGHGARFIAGNKGKINYNVIQGELKAERDIFGDCKEADASGVAVGYVDALGPVDVLCSHIPPAIADITFDVVARRFERGSIALLEYIKKYQPKYSLFGHVHQPLASRTRVGKTECINVGHFRATKRPFVLDL